MNNRCSTSDSWIKHCTNCVISFGQQSIQSFLTKKENIFLYLEVMEKLSLIYYQEREKKNMNYLKLIPSLKKINKLNRNYKILKIFKLGVAAAVDGLA